MKIRGNTVGTPIKPEKAVVKCQNLTEEEKAQARANIGAAAVGEGGSGGSVAPMIVTIRDERPSHTADVIIEHLANGGNAILIYNEEYLALDHYDDELVSFVRTNVEEGIAHQVDIYNDGTFDAYVFQAAGHSYVTDLVPTDAHINALIDAKLAELNSAEGVEF